jgi:hypothetical protein
VVLKRHFADLKMGAICENKKNLMKICVNGLEIFVELSGDKMPGHAFIDILVKSSKSEIQTIQLVYDHVLSRIEHLCSSPQGCQGVTLMRGVLRPRAVEKLLLCKNRTKQVALVEDLKEELLATNLDLELVHPWPQVDVQRDDHDFLNTSMEDEVASLLGEVATHDVLERHLQGLKDVEIDINNLPSSEQEFEHTQGETSESGDLRLQRSFHQMSLQEPTNLEQLIRDIMRAELRSSEERLVARISRKVEEVFEKTKQEIRDMKQELYNKLSKKLNGMTKLLFELHQQQVPCNAFFTTGGTKQQRRLVDGLMGIGVVYLHLLCEDINGIHVVDDQKGDEIKYVENENRRKIAHLVIVGFKIVLILSKVAAHVVGGVGNLVPDFAQGLALAYDAQNITDCIEDPRIHGGPIVRQSSTSHLPTARNALVEEHKVAMQWLVDFLRGKDIFKLFGLSRVRYLKMDSSHGDLSTIRWVCSRHKNEGLNNGTLEDCPT